MATPPVVDLHEDISFYYASMGAGQPLGGYAEDLEGRQADLPKYSRANVRIVFAAVFPESNVYQGGEGYPTPSSSRLLLLDQVKTYYALSSIHGVEIIESWRSAQEVLEAPRWRLGLLLHLEGADALADILDLELLHRLGFRSLGLTWNHDNRWAASCKTRRDYGLTQSGEDLVKKAAELGVIIDLAHASDKTVADAASASPKPVIVSHANFRWKVDSPRNVGEEAVEAVVSKGGVIGYSLISTLITRGRHPTLHDVASQMAEFVEVYGHRHLAIGTDYHGLLDIRPPTGLESIDRLPRLLEALADAGLSDRQIEAIAYGNIARVIREVLPES
ncbi:dipeptidase [Aeropyrum pernix K1]|uniref:Dipeptidase n=1 Tax=Aeropyrum pernix (strain ATCC 700893 / DSM 11879 / JCM 9820 / NBRC 100138 / K1) TaxID=272557 RepID=Q9YFA4_AERPE|nr:dipeptidase [Aeropyrum pernix]BAA79292.2 dipeptidase [Aeropyrum pernix K1]